MRLFAGVWPPPEVCQILAAMERPHLRGVRWTEPSQWHVTLAFLGEIDPDDVEGLWAALCEGAARAAGPPEVRLGPATALLGAAVLCAPVAGLDELAQSVQEAVRGCTGVTLGTQRFSGHLTLARSRRGVRIPAELCTEPLAASWVAREICLVRSVLDPDRARYTTLRRATVGF